MPVDMNSPSWTVYNELLKKHPPGQPAHPEALKPLSSGGSDFHPVTFDALDGTVIRSAAIRTQGLQAHLDWMLMDGDDFVLHYNRLLMICVTHWRWSHGVCVLPV